MPEDHHLVEGFFRSLQWDNAKKTSAFKHKRKFRDSIREYLHIECGVPKNETESTEIEKAVGRVQLAIRSRWTKKGAETKAWRKKHKKAARKRLLIKKATRAVKKYRAAKKAALAAMHAAIAKQRAEESPLLFGDELPAQVKPPRNVA